MAEPFTFGGAPIQDGHSHHLQADGGGGSSRDITTDGASAGIAAFAAVGERLFDGFFGAGPPKKQSPPAKDSNPFARTAEVAIHKAMDEEQKNRDRAFWDDRDRSRDLAGTWAYPRRVQSLENSKPPRKRGQAKRFRTRLRLDRRTLNALEAAIFDEFACKLAALEHSVPRRSLAAARTALLSERAAKLRRFHDSRRERVVINCGARTPVRRIRARTKRRYRIAHAKPRLILRRPSLRLSRRHVPLNSASAP
jgi:hypothetical protein